ncbi:hypothetical protein [Nocardioides pacificus]
MKLTALTVTALAGSLLVLSPTTVAAAPEGPVLEGVFGQAACPDGVTGVRTLRLRPVQGERKAPELRLVRRAVLKVGTGQGQACGRVIIRRSDFDPELHTYVVRVSVARTGKGPVLGHAVVSRDRRVTPWAGATLPQRRGVVLTAELEVVDRASGKVVAHAKSAPYTVRP